MDAGKIVHKTKWNFGSIFYCSKICFINNHREQKLTKKGKYILNVLLREGDSHSDPSLTTNSLTPNRILGEGVASKQICFTNYGFHWQIKNHRLK